MLNHEQSTNHISLETEIGLAVTYSHPMCRMCCMHTTITSVYNIPFPPLFPCSPFPHIFIFPSPHFTNTISHLIFSPPRVWWSWCYWDCEWYDTWTVPQLQHHCQWWNLYRKCTKPQVSNPMSTVLHVPGSNYVISSPWPFSPTIPLQLLSLGDTLHYYRNTRSSWDTGMARTDISLPP